MTSQVNFSKNAILPAADYADEANRPKHSESANIIINSTSKYKKILKFIKEFIFEL